MSATVRPKPSPMAMQDLGPAPEAQVARDLEEDLRAGPHGDDVLVAQGDRWRRFGPDGSLLTEVEVSGSATVRIPSGGFAVVSTLEAG